MTGVDRDDGWVQNDWRECGYDASLVLKSCAVTDRYTLPLGDPRAELDVVGGKGASLARMVRAGLPVPDGFHVTTAAYWVFVEENAWQPRILEALQDVDANEPASLDAASAQISKSFAGGCIAAAVAAAVEAAYTALASEHVSVAVRSSATAEDLPGASFAGQQETFLNVQGAAEVLDAVKRCWASLWTARAISYRAQQGIDHGAVSLAVVVQELVPSETAGVLFTAHPLTGKRDETVIDAAFGLGEALAGGQVEPDRYVVSADGAILSKTLGAKAVAIHAQAGGGTITMPTGAADRQALPDGVIRELADLGRGAAELYGVPQDVEWARVDGRLYLLQSRPITTLYPLPEGLLAEPLRVLFSIGSVQGMLDPMTPLGRDVVGTIVIGAGKIFGRYLLLETQTVIREAGERLWVDITALVQDRIGRRLTLATLPTVDPAASETLERLIEQGRFPAPRRMRARTALRVVWALIPVIPRLLRTLFRPDVERERMLRLFEAMLDSFEVRFAQCADLSERLVMIQEMAYQAFEILLPQFVPRFGAGMASINALTHLAAALPGNSASSWGMLRGVSHNVTTEMDLSLWRTAQTIGADPASAAHFQEREARTLADEYLRGQLPQAAQHAIQEFMERYGMRGLGEIDLGRPRWREEPLPILQTLRSYLDITDMDRAPNAVYARGKQAAEEEIDRLVAELRGARGGWIRARLARAAARRMRALLGLREAPKFVMIRILGIARRALLEDGTHLVAEGVLARPDDVFFLGMHELKALAAGDRRDWAALVQERRHCVVREGRRRQIPRLLLSDGQAFYEGVSAPTDRGGAVLHGDPVSPGVVEGVVRVVLDPRTTQLSPGEILVCPGTDPSWTPLFLTAGGLVMEVGGLMTHGAVVAREYGLPAAVGVDRATQRLRTGQCVRVDGSTGQVVVLGSQASSPVEE